MTTLDEAITALPGTAADIATFLTEQGLKGMRGEPGCCPIAVMPDHISEFVELFDDNAWPELISEPESGEQA